MWVHLSSLQCVMFRRGIENRYVAEVHTSRSAEDNDYKM